MLDTTYIKLYPSLSKMLRCQNASMIMSHMEYWFERQPNGFYKFIEPCNHNLYKEGDSWTEALDMTRSTFTRALKKIATRHSSRTTFKKEIDPFKGKMYASFYDRQKNQMFFIRNHERVESTLDAIPTVKARHLKTSKQIPNHPHISSTLQKKDDLDQTQCSLHTEQNDQSFIITKNTSKITSNISPSKTSTYSKYYYSTSIHNDELENMIYFWNQIIEIGKIGVTSTAKRAAFLKKALNDAFQGDIELWKEYCYKIASSKFLMGEVTQFKATIDFALKFETIQKIKEGQYGVGEGTIPFLPSNPSFEASILHNEIHSMNEPHIIQNLRMKLLSAVGHAAYKSWFVPLCFELNSEKEVKLIARSMFIKAYVTQNYRSHLQMILEDINIGRMSISVIGDENPEIFENRSAKEKVREETAFEALPSISDEMETAIQEVRIKEPVKALEDKETFSKQTEILRRELNRAVDPKQFSSWLSSIECESPREDGTLIVRLPSQFKVDWCQMYFEKDILNAARRLWPGVTGVTLQQKPKEERGVNSKINEALKSSHCREEDKPMHCKSRHMNQEGFLSP